MTIKCNHPERVPFTKQYPQQCLACLRVFTHEEVAVLERIKYVKRSDRVIVKYSCGHEECQPRPTGVTNPKSCLCLSCHPDPVAVRDSKCGWCDRVEMNKALAEMREKASKWW